MWTPADMNALPSQEDMTHAKKAIVDLEIDLKNTLEIIEQARCHLIELTNELEIHKAWIAPIRKLPVEIISNIFICNSKVDALGPITITEVCHRWRRIILDTPGAWCFIYPSKLKESTTAQHISTFLERSNPHLLHFRVPYSEDLWDIDPNPVELVISTSIHRFQCLDLWRLFKRSDLAQRAFSNLTRLSITGPHRYYNLTSFSRSHFPRLEYLDFGGRQTVLPPVSGEEIILPPLRYLSIWLDKRLVWCTIIDSCAATLKTLKISDPGDFRYTQAPLDFQVTLPVIETFENSVNMNFLVTNDTLPIHIVAPKLRYCSDTARHNASRLLLSDIDQIICLRTADISYITNYTALRQLQLDLTQNHHQVLNNLVEGLRFSLNCPALCLIQMDRGYEELPEVQSSKHILAIARPSITLEFPSRLDPIPGSMEELSVRVVYWNGAWPTDSCKCPSDMPCQSR